MDDAGRRAQQDRARGAMMGAILGDGLGAIPALIDRPAHAELAKAGTPVPVYLLENGAIA